jgi:hypothetical protein
MGRFLHSSRGYIWCEDDATSEMQLIIANPLVGHRGDYAMGSTFRISNRRDGLLTKLALTFSISGVFLFHCWISNLFLSSKHNGIILLCQNRKGHVTLGLESDVSSQAVRCGFTSGNTSGGVDIGNIDLHTGMVLGFDNSVSVRALSWHVKIDVFSGFVLHVDVLLNSLKRKREEAKQATW